MELDLDSILESHVDDDDDDHLLHHRTVDEILLNHSSSSSSSSPSPPSSPSALQGHSYLDSHNRSGGSSFQSLKLPLELHQTEITAESISSKQSSEFSSPQAGQSVLLPFYSGIIRSNSKPGDALAAAFAASRSIPAPRAAAIKSRKASSGVLQRTLESDETDPIASPACTGTDVSDKSLDTSGRSESSHEIGSEHIGSECNIKDQFQAAQVQLNDKDNYGREASTADAGQDNTNTSDADDVSVLDDFSIKSNLKEALSYTGTEVESPSRTEKDSIFHDSSGLDEIEDRLVQSLFGGEDNVISAENSEEAATKEVLSSPVCESLSDEDLTKKDGAKHEYENIIPQSKGEVSSNGDETDSLSDAAIIIEEVVLQRGNMGDSTKPQKNYHSYLKPLELAEEDEKKQAFTAMHLEEGASAQPMRLDGVHRSSNVLGYFDVDDNNTITQTLLSQAFRHKHGSSQVLAVHLNYIAVGMSKGSILVMPSRYSPHHADNMDAKMLIFGSPGDRSHVPVTCLSFNLQGDMLFAGYGDGHYTVWDVQKASVLKVVTEHKAPVVHLLYLGQDSQVTRQFFTVLSGDTKGVVNLDRFAVYSLFKTISLSKSQELLNESNSTTLCAVPLISGESYGGATVASQEGGGPSLIEEGVVILGTHQSALVAKFSPTFKVYAKIPRPDGVREGSMPYAAWKCMESHISFSFAESMSTETLEKVSLLAIAWDRRVQVAKLVKSELKVCWRWTTDSSAVGLAWLDEQILVIFTATGQLCLFSKDGNLIHQRSFAMDGSCGEDLMSYHSYFSNVFGNPEKAHHNCVGVRGATLYILRPSQLVVSRLLSWKERIEVLHKAGDWMSALNMAMSLYDGQAHAVIDLPKNLDDAQKTLMPYLVQLLFSYVDEVFSYIAVTSGNQLGPSGQSNELKYDGNFVNPDIKEQYTLVGGVSVEFCLHIKRLDVLFDEIFPKYVAVNHKDTFLELLEPYILKDMLGSLPPEIMQALVEHYSTKGWLQRVEQCVLHMDMLSLDFNQVVRLCREHRLHGALIYLFNKGLDDFRTPLEELFLILRDSKRESATALGYKMLVYLKYCFQGLAFPPGRGTLPSTRVPSLKRELVQFLLEEASSPNSSTAMCLPYGGPNPNLLSLLELDTEATLDVLRYAFVEDENERYNPLWNPVNSKTETTEVDISTIEGANLVQKVVDVLAVILNLSYFQTGGSFNSKDERCTDIWPTSKDTENVLDFISFLIASEKAKVSKDTLSQIFEYLTLGFNDSGLIVETFKRKQKQLTALIEVLPEEDWDAHYLLNLCERGQLHQVCGLIHAITHQYLSALDSFVKAVDEPILAFVFVDDMLRQLRGKESDAFRSAVISRIPDLLKLNREGTFFLIVSHLGEERDYILSQLRSNPESLFLYLKTLIEVRSTGTLNFSSLRQHNASDFLRGRKKKHMSSEAYLETLSDLPKLVQNYPIVITDQMTELYIELLCRYERKSVLRFLETSESYRVEHCLHICQEYGVIDAAAFLLERVGDIGSALLLLISSLNEKFILLDTAVESERCDTALEHFKAILSNKEVIDILEILRTCIGLCQRNSPRLDLDEAESLWFQLLDSFCEPLVDSHDHSIIRYKDEERAQEGEPACKIQWKVSKSHRNAHILRKLISAFIKEIVEGMIGYVCLPRIILKLLSDNETQEFGDFKPTILGMLGTYDFERRILDTAKSLIEDDTYSSLSLLKRGASHGFAPRSLLCCICNCPLTKDFSASGIQIFSCGHATHLQCEPQESEASFKGNSAGCPVCMPRKNSEKLRSKSILLENGLVKSISKSQQTNGMTGPYLHENDGFDNSYGLQSISRFDLLLNLQKGNQSVQIENIPQLRLAPPAVYHEKVKKRNVPSAGESSNGLAKAEKPTRSKHLRDVKLKGSSLRFPLKTNIFGKEKNIKL
ncbi:vacuolar protein sorting-associated protein 8 [Capsicum annuum]